MQTASPLYDLLDALDACAAEFRRIAIESAITRARLLQIAEPDTPHYTSADIDAFIAATPAPFWE